MLNVIDQLHHASAKPSAAVQQAMDDIKSDKSATDTKVECWLITSPMTFENIGFTKGVLSSSQNKENEKQDTGYTIPEGSSIRFLSCADCDCGPLGWHIEGKGSDLGRDVEQDVATQMTTTAQHPARQIREFLIPLERCRYKID